MGTNEKILIRLHYWNAFHKKYVWIATFQEVVENYFEIHRLANTLQYDFLKGGLSAVSEKNMEVIRLFNWGGGKTFGVAVMIDAYPRYGVEYLSIDETEFALED
jgi:hypothetical protein